MTARLARVNDRSPTVFLSGPTNSTFFTTCCEVAISDREAECPVCRQLVLPRNGDERWSKAFGAIQRGRSYGNPYERNIFLSEGQ